MQTADVGMVTLANCQLPAGPVEIHKRKTVEVHVLA